MHFKLLLPILISCILVLPNAIAILTGHQAALNRVKDIYELIADQNTDEVSKLFKIGKITKNINERIASREDIFLDTRLYLQGLNRLSYFKQSSFPINVDIKSNGNNLVLIKEYYDFNKSDKKLNKILQKRLSVENRRILSNSIGNFLYDFYFNYDFLVKDPHKCLYMDIYSKEIKVQSGPSCIQYAPQNIEDYNLIQTKAVVNTVLFYVDILSKFIGIDTDLSNDFDYLTDSMDFITNKIEYFIHKNQKILEQTSMLFHYERILLISKEQNPLEYLYDFFIEVQPERMKKRFIASRFLSNIKRVIRRKKSINSGTTSSLQTELYGIPISNISLPIKIYFSGSVNEHEVRSSINEISEIIQIRSITITKDGVVNAISDFLTDFYLLLNSAELLANSGWYIKINSNINERLEAQLTKGLPDILMYSMFGSCGIYNSHNEINANDVNSKCLLTLMRDYVTETYHNSFVLTFFEFYTNFFQNISFDDMLKLFYNFAILDAIEGSRLLTDFEEGIISDMYPFEGLLLDIVANNANDIELDNNLPHVYYPSMKTAMNDLINVTDKKHFFRILVSILSF